MYNMKKGHSEYGCSFIVQKVWQFLVIAHLIHLVITCFVELVKHLLLLFHWFILFLYLDSYRDQSIICCVFCMRRCTKYCQLNINVLCTYYHIVMMNVHSNNVILFTFVQCFDNVYIKLLMMIVHVHFERGII